MALAKFLTDERSELQYGGTVCSTLPPPLEMSTLRADITITQNTTQNTTQNRIFYNVTRTSVNGPFLDSIYDVRFYKQNYCIVLTVDIIV